MASIADLRGILLLEGLSDRFLEGLVRLTRIRGYAEGAVVYEEGAPAEYFYMLKRGKVLLEVELSQMITIALGSIKSGYAFGWSSLLGEAEHTSYAVCAEACEILVVPGTGFVEILNRDPPTGYIVMERIFRVIKRRLDRRTGQFLKVMRKHPDIQKIIDASDHE